MPHDGDHLGAFGIGIRVLVGDLEVHVGVAGEGRGVPGLCHLGTGFRPGGGNEDVIGLADGRGLHLEPGAVEGDTGLEVT